MILSMMLPSSGDEAALSLARQMGINNAITKAAPDLSGLNAPFDFDALETCTGSRATNSICRR